MEKPKLLIVAGPNGSGKTSVTSDILEHQWRQGCIYINPDNIARDVFGDWNSAEAVIKAARQATELREDCLAERASLIFETVLSVADKVAFVHRAKEAGYFVRLFFIGTDGPEINAARVALRVMDGGHDVPIPKIISRYAKSIAQCAALAPVVDRLYVYDNSVNDAPAKLLFRASNGCLTKRYAEPHDWASLIFQALSRPNG